MKFKPLLTNGPLFIILNDRMIHYLMETGFSHLRSFSFPHKRAALMALSNCRVTAQRPDSAVASRDQGLSLRSWHHPGQTA